MKRDKCPHKAIAITIVKSITTYRAANFVYALERALKHTPETQTFIMRMVLPRLLLACVQFSLMLLWVCLLFRRFILSAFNFALRLYCGRFIFSLLFLFICNFLLLLTDVHFYSSLFLVIQFNSMTAVTKRSTEQPSVLCVLLFLSSNDFVVMFWDLGVLLVPTSLWVYTRFQWCAFAGRFCLFVACVYMYHDVLKPFTYNTVFFLVFFLYFALLHFIHSRHFKQALFEKLKN